LEPINEMVLKCQRNVVNVDTKNETFVW